MRSGTDQSFLLGDQSVENSLDLNSAGLAEAFPFSAPSSGTTGSIVVYVDSNNSATKLIAGLYTSNHGHPGTRLTYGYVSGPSAGTWDAVTVPAVNVVAGNTYWIAILGRGGTLYFRDRDGGPCVSENSYQSSLYSLPYSWTSGPRWESCPISAYVEGTGAPSDPPPTTTTATTTTATTTTATTAVTTTSTTPTVTVPTLPPVNTAAPQVSGTATQGQTLTTSNGSWLDSPTSYTYAWQDCDSSGANCTNISGATSSTYTLASSDVGDTIRAVVTAINAGGSASATSTPTAVVSPPPPPTNTTLPQLTGTATQGSTLTTSNGSWTGSPTGYTYAWQDCDSSGANCTNISGATSSTYALASSDVGDTIRAVVTATNAGGSASAASNPTGVVSPQAPSNTAAPQLTGTAMQGNTLATSNGSWSGSPTGYAYAWQDCDSSGANCTTVSGAAASTYTLAASDVGHTVRSIVTATNAGGAASADSATSSVVTAPGSAPSLLLGDQALASYSDSNPAGLAQAFTYTATASGTATDIELYVDTGTTASKVLLGIYSDASGKPGTLLTSGSVSAPQSGQWNDVPISSITITQGTAYWIALLGTGGQLNFVDSAGATGAGASYVESSTGLTSLPSTYSTGNEWNASPASAYVNGTASGGSTPAPTNTAVPQVTGTTTQGDTLTTSNGTWTGSPTGYTYAWEDCDSSGASCTPISGATTATYTLTAGDVGNTIRARVTASNAGGSASATSSQTSVVAASAPPPPPANTAAPAVTGTTTQGDTLTTSNGTWTNGPTSYGYQWEDCDSAGANCTSIGAATGSSYTLQASDVNHTIRSVVTATNSGGSAQGTSTAVGPVNAQQQQQTTNCSPSASQTMTNTVSHLCGFADTTNTGVPPGTTLYAVPGTCTSPSGPGAGCGNTGSGWSWNSTYNYIALDSSNAVVKDVKVANGEVLFKSGMSNQTLEDSDIQNVGSSNWDVTFEPNVVHPTIVYNNLHGAGPDDTQVVDNAIRFGYSPTNYDIEHNNIYWMGSAINEPNDNGGTIEQNYMHDFVNQNKASGGITGYHVNGIQFGGGGSGTSLVQDNTCFIANPQTDCVAFGTDFGTEHNVTVNHNLLGGSNYTVVGTVSTTGGNLAFTNNSFSRIYYPNGGSISYVTAWYTGNGNVWSGNIWDDTGATVAP